MNRRRFSHSPAPWIFLRIRPRPLPRSCSLRASLEERFGTATIIIIAHRITTLSRADQVVVLEDGCIREQGTPEELRAAGGIYQKIYEIQYGLEGGAA